MDTSFAKTVSAIVAGVPRGTVATYRQVAALAGKPRAARAVGMIMSRNKDTKAVPCHRVVGSNGTLTGYAYGNGITTKKQVLQKEGVQFKGERVDLNISQWQPSLR